MRAVEGAEVRCSGDVHLRLASAFSGYVEAYVAANAGTVAGASRS